jgi:ABC-type proline/glycine betaine transport system permease subunit
MSTSFHRLFKSLVTTLHSFDAAYSGLLRVAQRWLATLVVQAQFHIAKSVRIRIVAFLCFYFCATK